MKISVFCIFRDSEKSLSRLFSQLEDIEGMSGFEFSYFFYENDSKDNTRELIKEWISSRNGKFLYEDLGAKKFGSVTDPERMRFLCECRNKCKDLAEENDSDYSLLIDSDISFNRLNFVIQLLSLQTLEDAVMTTPNVRQPIEDLTFGESGDSYYDVYAYRDNCGNKGIYFSDCPSFLKQDQEDWKDGKPIKALSAFGGFAIIKSKIFNSVRWSADINCDHCNMCYQISRKGQIYVIPNSVVKVDLDLSRLDMESCREFGIRQKAFYDFIWQ